MLVKFDQNWEARVVGNFENLTKNCLEEIKEQTGRYEDDVKFSPCHIVTLEGELILIAATRSKNTPQEFAQLEDTAEAKVVVF